MDFEKIVIDVFAKNGGEYHSEDLLFAAVLKSSNDLSNHQAEIWNAIKALISKGVICHDDKMTQWIYLNKDNRKKKKIFHCY